MPNQTKQCKHLEKLCTKLEQYEQYRKFKVYADKVLALGNDSLEKTIAIAVSLCLVCAVLVSFAAVALKPLQVNNKEQDMKKNILDVAGLLEEGKDIDSAFAEKIEAKIVNIDRKNRIIALSVKAKDAHDEAEAIKKYSRTEGSTTATLGDLLKEKMASKEGE